MRPPLPPSPPKKKRYAYDFTPASLRDRFRKHAFSDGRKRRLLVDRGLKLNLKLISVFKDIRICAICSPFRTIQESVGKLR